MSDVAFGDVHGLLWTPYRQVDTLAGRARSLWEGPDCVLSAYDARHPWQSIDQLSEDSPFANRECLLLNCTGLGPALSKSGSVHSVV